MARFYITGLYHTPELNDNTLPPIEVEAPDPLHALTSIGATVWTEEQFRPVLERRAQEGHPAPISGPHEAARKAAESDSGSLNENSEQVKTRNGALITSGLRVRVLSERFDSNVADPAFSGDMVRVNLHRGTMLVRPDDLHGREDDDTNCVGPERGRWWGKEFCPHPGQPCIDGCYFCGRDVGSITGDHDHTKVSKRGEPDAYSCCCPNC